MLLDTTEVIYAMERAKRLARDKASYHWPDLSDEDIKTFIEGATLIEFLDYMGYKK